MSGVAFCGPETYGPACGIDNIGYILLLFVGAGLYLWSDALNIGTPLPAIWLLAVMITSIRVGEWNTDFTLPALLLGAVALVFFIIADISYLRSGRRYAEAARKMGTS